MRLQEIDKHDFKLHSSQIVDLYIHSFGTGDAAQFLEKKEVSSYFSSLFEGGSKAILTFNENKIIGVLVFCPLVLDKDLPASMSEKFDVSKAIYIAELMVDAKYRGLGIAKSLLKEFDTIIANSFYSDAFIRVWDNNRVALRLYENAGFTKVDSIVQTKLSVDADETIQMNKIYLWRKINEI